MTILLSDQELLLLLNLYPNSQIISPSFCEENIMKDNIKKHVCLYICIRAAEIQNEFQCNRNVFSICVKCISRNSTQNACCWMVVKKSCLGHIQDMAGALGDKWTQTPRLAQMDTCLGGEAKCIKVTAFASILSSTGPTWDMFEKQVPSISVN